MKTKEFGGKKIVFRALSSRDIKEAKKFQVFINSLVEEDAQLGTNKRKSLKEETGWLENELKKARKKEAVSLVAECCDRVVGKAGIKLKGGRKRHVGELGISILKEFRGIGLGKYLMDEIIKEAKIKLNPEIIRLGVFDTNEKAISLYKRCGFTEVARIPKQIRYKEKLVSEVIMLLYL